MRTGSFKLARRGFSRMELAEPAHGYAIGGDARRPIRMEPRGRETGVRRKAIEVNGARLETRQHLFNCALEVVKFNSARGWSGALLRQAVRRR